MNEHNFSEKQLRDRQRLLAWMAERELTARALGEATGDFPSGIHMMTKGSRPINEAFKWRFRRAFGDDEATKVFPAAETEAESVPA